MPAPLLFTLAPMQPSYQIGEPIWLVIGIENRGAAEPVSGTIETNLHLRTDDLFVTVVGSDGNLALDPMHYPPPCCGSNSFSTAEAALGETAVLRIDLSKYAWLDAPGRYEVTLLSPFAATSAERPPPDDPRWVTTRVVMRPPDDPAALVASLPKTLDEAHRRRREAGDEWSRTDVNTYDALGHALYVPILEANAAANAADPDYPWGDEEFRVWDPANERDLYGLGACPCPEATEALLRLFDTFESDPEHRAIVMEELNARMPYPPREPSWFVRQTWKDEFVDDVLLRARRALEAPTSLPGWGASAAWAVAVLRRFGSPSDGPLIAKAMDAALAAPRDGAYGTRSSGTIPALESGLQKFPASQSDLSAGAALMVELQAWDGRTGSPPGGWEAVVLRGLASDDPAIVASAAQRLPAPASPAVLRAVLPHIGSPDFYVSAALGRYFYHHRQDGSLFLPMLKSELTSAEHTRVVGLLEVLKSYVPFDVWLDTVLHHIPDDPTNQDLLRLPLSALRGCLQGGLGPIGETEVPILWAAWQAALATRRSERREGPIMVVPGETDPALVPKSYSCKLASGVVWPSR